MAPELLFAFAIATLTFAVLPGPGVLYTVALSLAHGSRAGLSAALGLHLGGYVHVLASALGLAILFQTVPVLFTAMKLAGAAFLVWMGIAMLRARAQGASIALPDAARGSFRQSVLVEVLNPKTALFYLAFLPQFVSAEAALPVAGQLLILGVIVNVAFSLADVAYAVTAGTVRRHLAGSARIRAWAHRAGGTLLVGLGLNLALSRST
jgi:threonine/homoserine/homoserine lactone efflux protein